MYDVAIIGAGIVGAAAAHALSKYEIRVAVIEKEDDVAKGTTRANSAIIHAGYDPKPGTLMAKSNVRGVELWRALAEELGIEYHNIGSLVVAMDEADMAIIRELYEQGIENGVEDLRILNGEETKRQEPRLNDGVAGSLYAGTASIVNPWQSCIALSEYAANNGVDFFLNSPVTAVETLESGYRITAGSETIDAKYVVNAAGLHTEYVHKLAGGEGFGSHAVRGEYYILDRKEGGYVGHVVFPTPSKVGKGVVIAPTVHGNLLVGPTALEVENPDDTATTAEGQNLIRTLSVLISDGIPFNENIRNYAGNRAYIDSDDFLVAESRQLKGFINLAGIKSPGLSAAPALAEYVVELLRGFGLKLTEKEKMNAYRFPKRFVEMTKEEQKSIIKKDIRYGRVICRCETVTEGEIVHALSEKLTPPTISAIKRRCNAGLGRCQGGFCSVRVHEIIARERGKTWEEITMDGRDSYIVTSETKGARP